MMESSNAKHERNQKIYDLRKSGMTIQSLADKYGLNTKRVRDIIQKVEDKLKKAKV